MHGAFAATAKPSGYELFVRAFLDPSTAGSNLELEWIPETETTHTYLKKYTADENRFWPDSLRSFMYALYEQKKSHLLGQYYPYWAGFSITALSAHTEDLSDSIIGAYNNFNPAERSIFCDGLKDGNQASLSPRQAMFLVDKESIKVGQNQPTNYYGYLLYVGIRDEIFITSGCQKNRSPESILRFWLMGSNENPLHRARVMAPLLLLTFAQLAIETNEPRLQNLARINLTAAFKQCQQQGGMSAELPIEVDNLPLYITNPKAPWNGLTHILTRAI